MSTTLMRPAQPATAMEANLQLPLGELLSILQRRIMTETTYFGIPTFKNPLDFWVYQEILFTQKPDVVIEIGNRFGGSTLALAHFLDLLGHGRIIGIDIAHNQIAKETRSHPRITLIEGDACHVYSQVRGMIEPNERVLVIEDSSHTYENTLAILRTYTSFIKPGDYFIVEDGICHHGLKVGPSPGPYEAVETFVQESSAFEIDRTKESFCVTWNPKGYLRRRSEPR